jgi:hypothetical protein
VTAFCNSADSLIHNDHAHGKFIARRRDEVLQRRQNLYATAQQRRARKFQRQHFIGKSTILTEAKNSPCIRKRLPRFCLFLSKNTY